MVKASLPLHRARTPSRRLDFTLDRQGCRAISIRRLHRLYSSNNRNNNKASGPSLTKRKALNPLSANFSAAKKRKLARPRIFPQPVCSWYISHCLSVNICCSPGAMSPLASRNDEPSARDAIPSMSMGLNVDPEWGVPHSATPTPTGTPALGQKDFDRRIKRKYEAVSH